MLGCGAVAAFQSLLSLLWMFLTAPGWCRFIFAVYLHCLVHVQRCSCSLSLCISLSLNLYSEGSQGTPVVSGNRMVPAGVSRVCPQCLLSHTVREHVVLSVLPVHFMQILTLPQFSFCIVKQRCRSHTSVMDPDQWSCDVKCLI